MQTLIALLTAAAATLVPSIVVAQEREPAAGDARPPAESPAQRPRIAILPYLGSAPETGVQFGGTVFRVSQPADSATRPSTAQLFASYTAKSQARAFAEVDRWTTGNVWRLNAHVEWQRYPLPYYGTGDDAPEADEEFYTPRGVLAFATAQRRLRGPLYALAGYRYQDMRVVQTEEGGFLRDGVITGSRGGRVGQLQAGMLWDSRDNIFASERGTFVQATGSLAASAFGSDFLFGRSVLDARRFVRVGRHRVVALQGVLETTGGDAPFDQVSLVGNGNYLRGYSRGRFRDEDLVALQAEYRAPLAGRLGWAAFAGGGRIGSRLGDLVGGDARFLPSYGLGARWLLFARSHSTIRVDYARGTPGQSGLYVALNEAF
jgi:outer membrane protein assembly factor BamA